MIHPGHPSMRLCILGRGKCASAQLQPPAAVTPAVQTQQSQGEDKVELLNFDIDTTSIYTIFGAAN